MCDLKIATRRIVFSFLGGQSLPKYRAAVRCAHCRGEEKKGVTQRLSQRG